MYSQEAKQFFRCEEELQRRKAQHESMRDKEPNYRCVFRTRVGWAYTYHETYEEAQASFYNCVYPTWGGMAMSSAKKLRIEQRGPRGGYSKVKKDK